MCCITDLSKNTNQVFQGIVDTLVMSFLCLFAKCIIPQGIKVTTVCTVAYHFASNSKQILVFSDGITNSKFKY